MRALALLGAVVLAGIFVLAGTTVGLVVAVSRRMPDVTAVYTPPSQSSRIYAANGELIASLYHENRENVSLAEIPKSMRQAVIAIEDARFPHHRGVDVEGVARAVWHNLRSGRVLEGGSTITQQLARTLFLTRERVLSRKLTEMVLALEIERRLTKDEILERYLNEVYFGQGAYGIELAAHVYFGKPARDLTFGESAMLAGLIRGPSAYSPYQNLALARARQRLVLERMARLGFITPAQAEQAWRAPVKLNPPANAGLVGMRAPYFVTFIIPQLIDLFGEDVVYRGGLEVTTTLDTRLQTLAQLAVREGVERGLARGLRTSQGALVAIDPRTGEIKAMIGGYDWTQSKFNRAWQALRQPGSAFKPFIYTTAMASGVRPTRVLIDEPVTYRGTGGKPWSPKNYDKRFRGPVTLRRALEQSINVPAVRMLYELGPDRVIDYARRMGITSPLGPNLSLALGSSEVTVLEMASAYGTLANNGIRVPPTAILRVQDATGRVLYERITERQLALSPEVAYLMTDLLKGVIARGTGRRADIGRPAAGKTGTTDDYRNAWFIGFVPQLVSAVWFGNDDNSPMNHVVGGGVPSETWAAFMKTALAPVPAEDWARPEGVVGRGGELYVRGTEPVEPRAEAGDNGDARAGTPIVVDFPADGAVVKTPFTILGTAAPRASVGIVIVAEGGKISARLVETYVPADGQGRFAFQFAPAVPIPGGRYLITITTATSRGRASRTLTVTEATP